MYYINNINYFIGLTYKYINIQQENSIYAMVKKNDIIAGACSRRVIILYFNFKKIHIRYL